MKNFFWHTWNCGEVREFCQKNTLNNKIACSGDFGRGWNTAQLYRDYNKPIIRMHIKPPGFNGIFGTLLKINSLGQWCWASGCAMVISYATKGLHQIGCWFHSCFLMFTQDLKLMKPFWFYMRFFIQQVAQTLDDVLMGISNFFVFVFRQTYAFLASQFSCFIETWATNKGAGWLLCYI